MVLLFELVAVPYLTPWLGVRLSQRLGSAFEVPIYFIFPWLSRMGGGNLPVTLTALVLLFTCCACTNSVSGCCSVRGFASHEPWLDLTAKYPSLLGSEKYQVAKQAFYMYQVLNWYYSSCIVICNNPRFF